MNSQAGLRVLFVCSGNKTGQPGFVVTNQGESLRKLGVHVEYFTIKGRGFWGYFKNIPILARFVHSGSYDIVHSHFSLSSFVASLAGRFPLVVSLMGSDVYLSFVWRFMARTFYYTRWSSTIVKTEKMRELLKMDKANVIPNGVDLDRFIVMPKEVARSYIGFHSNKKLVVFVADPSRKEKNFDLAIQSVNHLKRNDIELLPVFNVSNEDIPFYLNAADLLILSSKWEGSVNVVKEAMACNLPIVSTDVGDVKENLEKVHGCYICDSTPNSLALAISKVLESNMRTNGREMLISLGLDSENVARKIIAVYEKIAR